MRLDLTGQPERARTSHRIRGVAVIRDARESGTENGYEPVELPTERAAVAGRYYRSPGARSGAVFIGGAGGGWDTPARSLYPKLCQALRVEGMASLRVRFRDPRLLDQSVHDVLAGLAFLQQEAVERTAVIGHSFGGAVAIQAAALEPSVRTVVTLATQSYGAQLVADLAPRASILLLHGTADSVLPARCSEFVYSLAGEPRRLIIYDGAGHGLDEVADQVERTVRDWLTGQLG